MLSSIATAENGCAVSGLSTPSRVLMMRKTLVDTGWKVHICPTVSLFARNRTPKVALLISRERSSPMATVRIRSSPSGPEDSKVHCCSGTSCTPLSKATLVPSEEDASACTAPFRVAVSWNVPEISTVDMIREADKSLSRTFPFSSFSLSFIFVSCRLLLVK